MEVQKTTIMELEEPLQKYPLLNKWNLFAHLPHDTNWSLKSYTNICTFEEIDQVLATLNNMSEKLIKNCMLFVMKEGITPLWEDENNRNGGCFSYKVNNYQVVEIWKKLCYCLVGESLISKESHNLTGITISPKKNFCIIKIWLGDCVNQNPESITSIEGLSSQGCLFKKHIPEK
jgi:hypothetical protein